MARHGGTILAVQDTTSLNYNTQTKMEGIGYICEQTLGVNIHSCLAVTADGLVLGVLAQSSYNREQPSDKTRTHESKRVRPLKEKESYRWVQTLGKTAEAVPEGDMYELFNEADGKGQAFLIRIVQNRKTAGNRKILDEIRAKSCKGKVKTIIPCNSRGGVKERETTLQIRYDRFEIKRPNILNKIKHLKGTREVNVIFVREEPHGQEIEPVEWFLMTNEKVSSAEDAYEKAVWYMQRWKIEQFHYVLKSGCAVEKLQEWSMDKTTMLVLMYSIIATFIMNITYIARVNPYLPCTVCFEEDEWKVLYRTANKTKTSPEEPSGGGNVFKLAGRAGTGPRRWPSGC